MEGFADLAASQARFVEAARSFAAAASLRAALGTPLSPGDQGHHKPFFDYILAKPDDPAIHSAWEEGQAMTLDQAIVAAMTSGQ